MKAAVKRERDRRNDVVGCSVLVGSRMPDWTTAQILAVHFRMHKAEGVLFQNALLWAAEKCKLNPLAVFEKEPTPIKVVKKIAELGKSVGAPWAKDQKDAALAALMVLQN